MFLHVRNEGCGEVEQEKNDCVEVSQSGVACFPGVREVVKYGHSVVEKVRVCLLSFTVSGTCSETSWLDGDLLS